MANGVAELYGVSTKLEADWSSILSNHKCPFINGDCWKTRKSEPSISIGTCVLTYGKASETIIICPSRLIDRYQIITDCIHLLTKHTPGNELHLLSEVSIPGGSVDYVLVSARNRVAKDFVGIELQTLDTTGSAWPARQEFLASKGIRVEPYEPKAFGMNWKHTAKTILVQMHHKAETFASLNRHLVLVIQDPLLRYLKKEFKFDHFSEPPDITDTVHIHSYELLEHAEQMRMSVQLHYRISSDVAGIAKSLGLRADSVVEEVMMLGILSNRLTNETVFSPISHR